MPAATMAPMTKRTYERQAGKRARAAILAHLAEQGESTTRELAAILDLSQPGTLEHVHRLQVWGFVLVRKGRNGGVSLTKAGQLALLG